MSYNSLYIHVPFCVEKKCDYCAFYSETHADCHRRHEYLEHLRKELSYHAPYCNELRSIFIGGGTPTALSPDELTELGGIVRGTCRLAEDCEWTMEANPESATPAKLDAAIAMGVNRFSFGVQSFSERLRKMIGRRGALDELPSIFAYLRQKGIRRLNLDMIYAIPGETPDEWRQDLETAFSYLPTHLSCYSLITEEDTPLGQRAQDLPRLSEEDFLSCWKITEEMTSANGLRRYEISNFAAAPEEQCRHNWEIWHGQTYLGIGPAAVSFDGTDRFSNPASLSQWLDRRPPEIDRLPPPERAREIFAFAFRTVQGWDWQDLEEVAGLTQAIVRKLPSVRYLQQARLLEMDGRGIRPSAEGLLLNDDILGTIIEDSDFPGME